MDDRNFRVGPCSNPVAVLLVALALSAWGCAAMRELPPAQTEQLLGRSGFERRSLSDPKVAAQAESLPIRKLVKMSRADGSQRFVYKDPKGCHCVWVGTEEAYGDYRAMLQEENQAYAIDGSSSPAPFASDDAQEWAAQGGLW